jgi:nucleosome binding factor SPN SPT16 subunit
MDRRKLKKEVRELIELAQRLRPEGEGIDLSDREYSTQDMAEIRSYISGQRKAIDVISGAIAVEWNDKHKDKSYDDGNNIWSLSRTKGKVIVDSEQFYKWLATKDADQLAKLVSATAVKVGGMSVVERETLLDETPRTEKLSLNPEWNK